MRHVRIIIGDIVHVVVLLLLITFVLLPAIFVGYYADPFVGMLGIVGFLLLHSALTFYAPASGAAVSFLHWLSWRLTKLMWTAAVTIWTWVVRRDASKPQTVRHWRCRRHLTLVHSS